MQNPTFFKSYYNESTKRVGFLATEADFSLAAAPSALLRAAPSTVTRDFASGALIALANVGGERAAGGAARGALIAVRPALLAMAARDEFAADLVLNQLRHVYG